MENSNALERLSAQVGALIDTLEEAREEVARLNDELGACRAITRQREESVSSMEESLGLKDMELEDLAERIEKVLGGLNSTSASSAEAALPAQAVRVEEAVA